MISGGRRQSCNILRVVPVAHQRPGDIDKQLIHTELQSERAPLLFIFTHLTSSSHLSLWWHIEGHWGNKTMQVIFPRGDFSMWSRAVTMKWLVNVRCHLSFIVLPITSSARPCDHLTTSCVCVTYVCIGISMFTNIWVDMLVQVGTSRILCAQMWRQNIDVACLP